MKTYVGLIHELKDNQVFVFGSNLNGFHGGGAAGFASFGKGVAWRTVNYADKPDGWQGKWNVKGEEEGLQEGVEGMSYALPTCTKSGGAKTMSLDEIKGYIKRLYECAEENPDKEFLIAYTVSGGRLLNGYTIEDMADCFGAFDIPPNIVFEEEFLQLVVADKD